MSKGVVQFEVYRLDNPHLSITTLESRWRRAALLSLFRLLDEEIPEKAINLLNRRLSKTPDLTKGQRYNVFNMETEGWMFALEAQTAREAALEVLACMETSEMETALNLLGWVMVARRSSD